MIFPVLLRLICAFDNSHTLTEAQGVGEEQVEVEDGSQDGPHDGPHPEDLRETGPKSEAKPQDSGTKTFPTRGQTYGP